MINIAALYTYCVIPLVVLGLLAVLTVAFRCRPLPRGTRRPIREMTPEEFMLAGEGLAQNWRHYFGGSVIAWPKSQEENEQHRNASEKGGK